jgi:hypothetical protein
MRDMLSNTQMVDLGVVSLSGTTPAASAWVDTLGYDAATLVLVTNTVTVAGTSGFTATAQHSDTTVGGDAAAIVAADSVAGPISVAVTLDTADNVIAGAVGYKGSKRYVRFNVVGTTNTNASARVFAMLNMPARAPATFIGASVAAT